MTDTFERRITILEILKRKEDGVITIPQIIQRLSGMGMEIKNNKTIERDMQQLSTQFNIGCDDSTRPFKWWWSGEGSINIPGMGRYSALTYRLAQQYLEPLLPPSSLACLQPRFKQARQILAEKNKEKERRWVNKIKVIPKTLQQLPAKVPMQIQEAIYEALYEEKMLMVTYKSRNDEVTTRKIHPLALIYRNTTTELVFCGENSRIIQRFILNRIQEATILIQSAIIPDDFNLEKFINDKIGFPGTCQEINFKAWVSASARHNIEETPLSEQQSLTADNKSGYIVTAKVRDTAELTAWILGLGARIRVIEPTELREKISGIAKTMAENYSINKNT